MSKAPQQRHQNSDVKKEYKIEPEPSLELKPFQSFPKYSDIESIQQFYKSFLQQDIFLAQRQNILKQFNILSQEQKGYTIRRVKFFIQKLQKQKLAKDYDSKTIKQMIEGFQNFQFELNEQIIDNKNNSKKQKQNGNNLSKLQSNPTSSKVAGQQAKLLSTVFELFSNLFNTSTRPIKSGENDQNRNKKETEEIKMNYKNKNKNQNQVLDYKKEVEVEIEEEDEDEEKQRMINQNHDD